MTAILNISYVGQVGTGANEHGNDCGAASAAMIIAYCGINPPTVDELYHEARPSGNLYLSVGDILSMLSRRGIKSEWDANLTTKDLFWTLADGSSPVIALVRYGALSSIRPNNFTGSHFLVVVGMDLDTVYVHDPLNTPTTGEKIAIPMKVFENAWSSVGDSNPQRSLIIPRKPVGVGTPPVTPKVLKVVHARDKDGCNIRSVPGGKTEATKLRSVVQNTPFSIYEIQGVWGRIHPTKQEWVCLEYTE